MIKLFVMQSCQDCTFIEKQISQKDPRFEIIDIGEDVKNLKIFLSYRDSSSAFDSAKALGKVGIPCFVLQDGTVTLNPEDVGLESRPTDGFCSLDKRGC